MQTREFLEGVRERVLDRAAALDENSDAHLVRELAAERHIPEEEARRQTRDALAAVADAILEDPTADPLSRLPGNLKRPFPARHRA